MTLCERCGRVVDDFSLEDGSDCPEFLQVAGELLNGFDADAVLCDECREELGLLAAGSLFEG
ncbi:MAG: hypothetical protein GXP50_03010 [Deltaproteobacteria bacterium]|nr:hypothetical protein [Deltaproteobacteria bacterium]